MDVLSKFAVHPEDAFWNSVSGYLASLDKKLAEATLVALADLRDAFDEGRVADMIMAGDYDRAVAIALGTNVHNPIIFAALHEALDQAAQDTMRFIQDKDVGQVQVPRLLTEVKPSQATYNAIDNETMQAVQQISDATRDGLKTILTEGVKLGDNPRTVARDMKQLIGLTDRDAKALANYRTELERGSLKALSRQLRNRRYDRMIREDRHYKKIDALVEDYKQRLLKARAETIARTEAARALNIGQQQLWEEIASMKDLPPDAVRRRWLVAPGERTCEICKAIAEMNNEEGVGLLEPFVTPDGMIDLPPKHPNCRCSIQVTFDLAAAIRARLNS